MIDSCHVIGVVADTQKRLAKSPMALNYFTFFALMKRNGGKK